MTTVPPIPEGFRSITPHLCIEGAAKAIDFYKAAFNAEEVRREHAPDGRIMHATVKIGDSLVMLVDDFPEYANGKSGSPAGIGGSPVTIHMYVPNVDEVVAQAEAAGATVLMPVSDMFWGDRFGMCIDPFGHKWTIATQVKIPTPEEAAAAMAEAFAEHPGK